MRSSNGVKPHSLRKQDSLEDRVLGSEIHQGNGKWQGFSWPCPNICRIIGVEIQESPPPPGCLLGFCCFVLFVGGFFRFFVCLAGLLWCFPHSFPSEQSLLAEIPRWHFAALSLSGAVFPPPPSRILLLWCLPHLYPCELVKNPQSLLQTPPAAIPEPSPVLLLLVSIFSPCITCGSYYPLAETADVEP